MCLQCRTSKKITSTSECSSKDYQWESGPTPSIFVKLDMILSMEMKLPIEYLWICHSLPLHRESGNKYFPRVPYLHLMRKVKISNFIISNLCQICQYTFKSRYVVCSMLLTHFICKNVISLNKIKFSLTKFLDVGPLSQCKSCK